MVPEAGRRAVQQRPEGLAIERRARAAIDAAVQPTLPKERRLSLRPGCNQRTLFQPAYVRCLPPASARWLLSPHRSGVRPADSQRQSMPQAALSLGPASARLGQPYPPLGAAAAWAASLLASHREHLPLTLALTLALAITLAITLTLTLTPLLTLTLSLTLTLTLTLT